MDAFKARRRKRRSDAAVKVDINENVGKIRNGRAANRFGNYCGWTLICVK